MICLSQTDSKGAIAAIGTTLEIESHVLLPDGRMGVTHTLAQYFW